MQTHRSDIVLSLKGRDAGALFLVVGEDEQRLYLADGRTRRVESPKRKNRAHCRHEGTVDVQTASKLQAEGRLTNNDIRKALAAWAGEVDKP